MSTVQFNINSSQELEGRVSFTVVDCTLSSQGEYIVLTHNTPITSLTSLTSAKGLVDKEGAVVLEEIAWSYDNVNFEQWRNLATTDLSTAYVNQSGSDVWFKMRYTKTDAGSSPVYVRAAEIVGERTIQGANTAITIKDNSPVILEPEDIFKVFSLTAIEITASGIDNNTFINVMVRTSTNSGRTWTEWIEVTDANISSIRFEPLRFTKFQFSIMKSGEGVVDLLDIELVGDFQNVSANYKTTSRLGLRSDCSSGGIVDPLAGSSSSGPSNNPGGKYEVIRWQCDECVDAPKYDPYKSVQGIMPFYEYLSNQVNSIYGHEVEYFLTDPDGNGDDSFIHEYQLYNTVKAAKLKVSVPDNTFPDNQIKFNLFDLDLFDSFEVHMPAAQFRQAFGIEKRPAKEDYLFMCKTNRMYKVEHVTFNRMAFNSTIFYKLVLTHYNQAASKQVLDAGVQASHDKLLSNTTLESILGIVNGEEAKDVTQPIQRAEITENTIVVDRNKYTDIVTQDLVNSTVVVSKSAYKLTTQKTDIGMSVSYGNIDGKWNAASNRTLNMWVSFSDYDPAQVYNLFDNHDGNNGYKLVYTGGTLTYTINDDYYTLNFSPVNDSWYCISVITDQVKNTIKMKVFSRTSESEPSRIKNSNLKLVASNIYENLVDPLPDHTFDINKNAGIGTCVHDKKANYYITNVRLFKCAVPDDRINVIMNQNIATDGSLLIMADNAEARPKLPYYGSI